MNERHVASMPPRTGGIQIAISGPINERNSSRTTSFIWFNNADLAGSEAPFPGCTDIHWVTDRHHRPVTSTSLAVYESVVVGSMATVWYVGPEMKMSCHE